MAVSDSVLGNDDAVSVVAPLVTSTSGRAIRTRAGAFGLFAVETLVLSAVWLLALSAWRLGPPGAALLVLMLTVGASLAVAVALGLYDDRTRTGTVVDGRRLLLVVGMATFAAVAGSYLHRSGPWLAAAAVGGALTALALGAVRGGLAEWNRAERAAGRLTRPVVVIGTNGEAAEVLDLIINHPDLGFRVHGLVGDEAQARAKGVAWLGEVDTAVASVFDSGVDDVIITPNGVPSVALNLLIRELLKRDIHVQMSSGFTGVSIRRLHRVPLAHEPFIHVKAARLTRPQMAFKRTVDFLGASAILLIGLPFLAMAALATKLTDRGPVLFRQTRVGLEGRPFVLLKLRTMVTDAEARLAELSEGNQRNGPLFKLDKDPRVTTVGRVLRATSLDELPQLWNVLRGDMSLVGPRPALPSEVEQFDLDLHARHRMKPGVTGLWQIEARDNPSFYAYRHLDLFYVENSSPIFDLAILLRTIPSVVVRTVRPIVGRSAPIEPQKGELTQ